MVTVTMTREEVLLKLLAVEPERQDRIRSITGWPSEVTVRVLAELEAEGRIGWRQTVRGNFADYREYFLRQPL